MKRINTILLSLLMASSQLVMAAESCVTLSKTTDVAGHSCCILPPPDKLNVDIKGSQISFSSNSMVTWLPLDGQIDGNGSVNMQGTSTVAGFPGVTTTFSGSKSNTTITGTFTVGAEGLLPESQPIIYDVSIDTACGSSSGCEGTYQNADMEIVLASDLTGTVSSAGLEGTLYGVNEYDSEGNVCFISAFVSLSPNSCDIAVAGRLEVKTSNGIEQGHFDFGGGNSCSGVVSPFSLTLPKIK